MYVSPYFYKIKQKKNRKNNQKLFGWLPTEHGQEWGRSGGEVNKVEGNLQVYLCFNFDFTILLRIFHIHK